MLPTARSTAAQEAMPCQAACSHQHAAVAWTSCPGGSVPCSSDRSQGALGGRRPDLLCSQTPTPGRVGCLVVSVLRTISSGGPLRWTVAKPHCTRDAVFVAQQGEPCTALSGTCQQRPGTSTKSPFEWHKGRDARVAPSFSTVFPSTQPAVGSHSLWRSGCSPLALLAKFQHSQAPVLVYCLGPLCCGRAEWR